MTWVKVCGLSRPEEVAAAVEAGADAVGFVSVPRSPRFLPLDAVGRLAGEVPASVLRVLLTLDLEPARLHEVVDRAQVDGIQPYGQDAVALAQEAARSGLFVLLPAGSPVEAVLDTPPGVLPLYDSTVQGLLGGTGRTFDWSSLEGVAGDYVVAGGLGPDNVGDLVDRIAPWGVDASSRLEHDPGVKDLGKVAAFVREAKRS